MNAPHQPDTDTQGRTATDAHSHTGSCHCGAVKFEVTTPLLPATRCDCSLCRRRGALMSPSFPRDDLRILAGEDALTLYQFNTRVARHYFCKHCGVYPFHQTRMNPGKWRVNLGCLDGVDLYSLPYEVANGAAMSVVEQSS